jgi:hypothetical protein
MGIFPSGWHPFPGGQLNLGWDVGKMALLKRGAGVTKP